VLESVFVVAAVQVAHVLRIPPCKSTKSSERGERDARAVRRWRHSFTGMSLPCAPKEPSNSAHNCKRPSRCPLATRAQNGLCRPNCAGCAARKLHVR
jgi:hypothetical protein